MRRKSHVRFCRRVGWVTDRLSLINQGRLIEFSPEVDHVYLLVHFHPDNN